MDIQNLKDLTRVAKEEEINPFRLLGIETWVLRSMGFESLKLFLSDFKKIIGKYHHPDKFIDEVEKKEHEDYFQLVSPKIDKMLEDEFYFRKSLDDLRSGDILDMLQGTINHQENELKEAKATIKDFEEKISENKGAIKNIGSLFLGLKQTESKLIESSDVVPLVTGFRCNMTYSYFYDVCDKFMPIFYNLVDKHANNLLNLEAKCREATLKFVKSTPDSSPLFNGKLNARKLKSIIREGKSSESVVVHHIIGSLPYSAIKEYLNFYGMTKTSINDFLFYTPKGTIGRGISEKIMPFVSNFIFPSTLFFAKKETINYRKRYELHELILPIKISDIRYMRK